MKKGLLFTTLTALSVSGFAQTFVSTTPENRNAVLEEYTGIYCGFCPDGHRRAQEFQDANPNDVVLVNIHVGDFAAPGAGDPDFRTSFGTALDNAAGTCGYPAGSMNREAFTQYLQTDNNGNPCGAVTAQSRGSWATTGAIVLGESSAANVAGEATLNLSTGELSVNTEVYYTANGTGATNKLSVAVLQSNVKGPQSGSGANPTQINEDGSYTHNHMLRHLITGQYGMDVSGTTMGSFHANSHDWTAPANINGVPVVLDDLEVVVFLAEGNQDIITGSKVDLVFSSDDDHNANLFELDAPSVLCGTDISPRVYVKNFGSQTMTSLVISTDVNGTSSDYNWSGSLATGEGEWVTIPSVSFTPAASNNNTLMVTTSAPNGNTDADMSDNSQNSTFSTEVADASSSVEITITTDNYGSETTWEVEDPSGNVILSGGPYTDVNGGETFVENLTGLADGCYKFIVYDAYPDGMCCQYGDGGFMLRSGFKVLHEGGEFGSVDERLFRVDQNLLGVNDLELVNNVSVYPNPFNDNAQINFNVVENGVVSLDIVNVLGAKVFSQNLGEKTTGAHSVNISADGLESGIYMVNLMVNGSTFSTRVSIAK